MTTTTCQHSRCTWDPSQYYADGYKKGLTWSDDWIPGGPWVCGCTKCAASSAWKKQEWHRGFREGYSKQHEETTA